MTTAEQIEEKITQPNDLYWGIEQVQPGMIPESLGVDFSGYPFGDGSGFVVTETEGGETRYAVCADYRKELPDAVALLRAAL